MKRPTKQKATQRRRLTDREHTAYHEAGHVVASYLNNLIFEYVTIKPDDGDGTVGHVKNMPWNKDLCRPISDGYMSADDANELERWLFVKLSGAVTIEVLGEGSTWKGGELDRDQAVDLAIRLGGDGDGATDILDKIWNRAEKQLAKPCNFRAVEALARALLKNETILYPDAVSIIKRAIEPD